MTKPRLVEHGMTTERVFLRLGPNGALGADEHQWILYRAGNAVSFVRSTKLILARCIREKGIELSLEGRAALDALACLRGYCSRAWSSHCSDSTCTSRCCR